MQHEVVLVVRPMWKLCATLMWKRHIPHTTEFHVKKKKKDGEMKKQRQQSQWTYTACDKPSDWKNTTLSKVRELQKKKKAEPHEHKE